MGSRAPDGCDPRGRRLSKIPARPHPTRGRSDPFSQTVNYAELLRLAAPETTLVITALAVLALGLLGQRTSNICSGIAAAGLLFASSAVFMLPPQATLFNGMLVITPL